MVMEETRAASTTGPSQQQQSPPSSKQVAPQQQQQQQQQQEQAQQQEAAADDRNLPGKVVLGPPAFVEKLNRFKNQGPSRLGNEHLMKHVGDGEDVLGQAEEPAAPVPAQQCSA